MVDRPATGIAGLIGRLDAATALPGLENLCAAVKAALAEEIAGGDLHLPPATLRPSGDGYARHPVHRSEDGRYSVLAMVWAPGQGTPIHDHAGKWCVEGVYDGRIRVTSYDLLARVDAARVRLAEAKQVTAGVGEAGALIPPFDYHVIENPYAETAVTLHVYGGDMDGCHAFHPAAETGVYEKTWRPLTCSAGEPCA